MPVLLSRRSVLREAVGAASIAAIGTARSSNADPQPRRKYALLVAVSKYRRQNDPRANQRGAWGNLPTDYNVRLLDRALRKHEFPPEDILTVVDWTARYGSGEKPHPNGYAATKDGILKAAREHLLERVRPGDFWMLYLAGHGQQIPDEARRRDEPDGLDESLVPVDWEQVKGGDAAKKNLRDDDLRDLLAQFTTKRNEFNGQLGGVVILETCHAGTLHLGQGLTCQGRAWDPQVDGPPPDVRDADRTQQRVGFRGVGEHRWPVLMASHENEQAWAFHRGPLPRDLNKGELAPGSLFTQSLCRQLEKPTEDLTYQQLLKNADLDIGRWVRAFAGEDVPKAALQRPYGDGPLATRIFT